MKTIQEYLQSSDIHQLVNKYFQTYPIEYESEECKPDLTVAQIRAAGETNLTEYIHKLQAIGNTPCKDGKEYILFAHKYLHEGIEDVTYSLVCKQELLEKGAEATTYAYEFSKPSEIMGYWVSDSALTQNNIYELMVDVLYEASFFGYNEEDLENAQKELDEAITEVKNGECKLTPLEELFSSEIRELAETDEIEEKYLRQYMDAEINYNFYCVNKELVFLKKLLLETAKGELAESVPYDDIRYTRLEKQYKNSFIPTFDDEARMWVVDTEHGVEFGSAAYVAEEFCGDGTIYLFNDANMPDPQCPNHVHEFERVIINLMKNPEEFSVEGFHDYYSSQELRVLHNLQDALLKVNERNYPLTREEMLHSNDDSANKR